MNLKNIDSAIEALQLQREIQECKEREAPEPVCFAHYHTHQTSCGSHCSARNITFLAAEVTCPECLRMLATPAEIKHLDYGYLHDDPGDPRIFLSVGGRLVAAFASSENGYQLRQADVNKAQQTAVELPLYTITGNLGGLVNE